MPADSVMSVNGIAGMTTVDFSRPAGRESVASRGGAGGGLRPSHQAAAPPITPMAMMATSERTKAVPMTESSRSSASVPSSSGGGDVSRLAMRKPGENLKKT